MKDPLTYFPDVPMTVTLSSHDLDKMREGLLLAMKKTPESRKGSKQWLAFNRAYDNLVDAMVRAKA